MRAMLIDDHPLIASAMQRILRELDEGAEVVTAGSAAAAREVLRADTGFDLLLLDLALPDADGHAFLGELRRTHPCLPIVVVSASERAADVVRAIDAGAMGFVTKRATPQALLQSLRAVLQGVIVVPDELASEPLPEPDAGAVQAAQAAHAAHAALGPAPAAPAPGLDARASLRACLQSLGMTPRQLDVLELLLQGKPNKLIARELRLSVETVKDHVRAVLRTLNVTTRTQAVLAVSRLLSAPGSLAPWTQPATR
jgi:DNA-binding NarL/FixJ family response regulator